MAIKIITNARKIKIKLLLRAPVDDLTNLFAIFAIFLVNLV
jgi:hypothetical protein